MSNFEDYDLRQSTNSGRTRRPASGSRPAGSRPAGARPTGSRPSSKRPASSRPARANLSYNLDDELDMYGNELDIELGSESMSTRRPASSSSRASSRSASGRSTSGRSTTGKRPASSSRNAKSTASGRPVPSSRKTSNGNGTRGGKPMSSKAKKKKLRRNLFIIEVVVLLLLLLIFFLWSKFGKVNWDNINMEELENTALDSETKEVLNKYTTLALFGVDNRSNGNLDSGNSDTIMLVSINNDTKDVKMVSIQRDTYMLVADDTYRKCNYAYNHGGVESAIEMLNKNLDLNISGYVSVDFYALATVVDDLGGLDLEITQRMIDTDNEKTGQNALAGYIAEVENLMNYYPDEKEGWKMSDCYFDKPGTYHLNGAQVVGYCRNRYAVNNDYGRAENQRKVIKLIVEKAKKADIGKLNKIADDVFPKISTSLSLSQCIGMAASVADYNMAESSGFPFALTTMTVNKKTGSVVVPCTLTSNVQALHKFLYEQEDYDATDDVVDVISEHIIKETGKDESSADINQTSDGSKE